MRWALPLERWMEYRRKTVKAEGKRQKAKMRHALCCSAASF
jgi:hypothetical protein